MMSVLLFHVPNECNPWVVGLEFCGRVWEPLLRRTSQSQIVGADAPVCPSVRSVRGNAGRASQPAPLILETKTTRKPNLLELEDEIGSSNKPNERYSTILASTLSRVTSRVACQLETQPVFSPTLGRLWNPLTIQCGGKRVPNGTHIHFAPRPHKECSFARKSHARQLWRDLVQKLHRGCQGCQIRLWIDRFWGPK